jgi:hypothetical protein
VLESHDHEGVNLELKSIVGMTDVSIAPGPNAEFSWKALRFEDRIVASAVAALEATRADVVSATDVVKYFRVEKIPLGVARQECQVLLCYRSGDQEPSA